MQTVFTHNGGFDAILLVDDDDTVVSAWPTSLENLRAYLADGDKPDEWNTGVWDGGFDGDETAIEDYGSVCGRNGTLAAERREFYLRSLQD